jgi:hypothetical protein
MAFNPNSFSYSALKQFETCPRQYAEITVFNNFKNEFTSKNGEYGDRLHKASEAYVQNGGALDNEFGFIKPILDTLRHVDGKKYTEYKMGVALDGTPRPWNASDRWFQGIADLAIVGDSPVAHVVDYKTGDAKYADTDQLELMSLLIFAHHPHIKLVKGALLFVLSEQIRKRTVDIREQERLWQKYKERDAKRVAAYHANVYPARSSGLCKKHCVVLTCEHNGRR